MTRVYLMYGGMLLFAAAILFKLIHIQFIEGPVLLKDSEEQTLRYFDVEAVRGSIYASDGSLLATSVPVFDIRMDVASPLIPDEVFNSEVLPLATSISRLFGDKPAWKIKSELVEQRKKGNRYYLLRRNVTYPQLNEIRQFPIFNRGRYRGGLIVVPGTRREKPYGLLAERTIGYEKPSEQIRVGLEGAYGAFLSGLNGKQLRRRVSNGEWRPVFDEHEVEPENGKDVVTTLDVSIQDVAEDALLKHLEEHRAAWGCVVLMEVKTGHIKAIANLHRDSADGTYQESYNYAIGASIEPGSTFKLASMISLLEDGLVDPGDTIDIGRGVVTYHGIEISDVHPLRDGRITVREAFEHSSNAGISTIVHQSYAARPQQFIDRLFSMSLGEPLGLEIPGEGKPFIKDTRHTSWSGVSLPFMSIGYELKITPLQLLTFYNAVANGGTLVRPMFASEIRQAGKTVEKFSPVVINRSICSESTLSLVQEMLEGVVQNGTATRLKKSVCRIAGKTGTAQIANRAAGYDKSNYNASFVGYFPADHPEYSCIVVVSRPSTGRYYASSVAVPVFKEITEKVYATQLEIQPREQGGEVFSLPRFASGYQQDIEFICRDLGIPLDTASSQAEWVITVHADSALRLDTKIIRDHIMPNVLGMGARDAMYILERLGLSVKIVGTGYVREQSVPAGSPIDKGGRVTLKLNV